METLNLKFGVHGIKNEFARTETDFFSISEVSTRVVTLKIQINI